MANAGQLQHSEPHRPRRAALAADHRVAPPAQHDRLRPQQHDGENQQRQRRRRTQLRLGRKLEQAPDLGGHGVKACRQRQDRRRPEQRHGLQKGDQCPRQQCGQGQRNGDAARRAPGTAAEHRRSILQIARNAVQRIGDQHEDVGERVAGDDEDQPRHRVDVEQRKVRAYSAHRPVELVQQPAIGRRQQLPGDGAEERRRHERGHHQNAHSAPQRHVGAGHDPSHRRGHQAADDADRRGNRQRCQQRVDECGIGEQRMEVGERRVARAVGEGKHHQPADRQDDQQAQRRGKQRHHRTRQVDA